MSEHIFNNEELRFAQEDYDLDGLVRLIDSEEASIVLMYYDEEDDKYYRNRYEILECDRGITYTLQKIQNYLEQEDQSLFIAFAATYEGKLNLLGGKQFNEEDVNMGELELGDHLVYGLMINLSDDNYQFNQVLYHDGGEKSQSWAEVIEDAGILGAQLKQLILQFA